MKRRISLWEALRFQSIQFNGFGPDLWSTAVSANIDIFQPISIVRILEIFAVMRAAAVFARERAARDEFGGSEHIAHIQSLLPREIEATISRDTHLPSAIFQCGDVFESLFQFGAVPHDADSFPHNFAEFLPQHPRTFSL